MGKMISYGDDLFFIAELARVLKDGLELDLDSATYSEKIGDEILFLDRSLTRIYASLRESPLLIDRPEHLKSLMRTAKLLADLIDGLLHGRLPLCEGLRPLFPKLADVRDEKRRLAQEVQALLAQSDSSESGDMISPAEYEYLLMDADSESHG